MNKVRFGIIGCGAIADIHCQALSHIDNAELAAVADVHASAAERLGEKYRVDWYANVDELLQRKDIEAVIICTPSGLHGDAAIRAARSGKNILVEKPFETTQAKIDEVIRACGDNGVLLGAVYNYRYKKDSRRLGDLLRSGRLGNLIMGSTYVKWYRDPSYYTSSGWRGIWAMDGGGALMNQSIHMIDLLQWYMGPVDTVFGFAGRLLHKGIETEDTAAAVLRFKNGALGVIEGATSVYPGFVSRIEITGENGTAILEDGILILLDLKNREEEDITVEKSAGHSGSGGASEPMDIGYDDHKRLLEDYICSVMEKKPFWLDGYEAGKAVQIITAIYESARTGQPVQI